jgi:two-component sensor histidine kinase/CHASE3 domain sensor protein
LRAPVSRIVTWVGAAVVVTTVGASILLLASALATQHRTGDEIRRHFENVLALRRTQALLVDAETGQRGFLLTSKPGFLAPYSKARQEIPGELRELIGARVDAPGDRLVTLSAIKLREIELTLELARAGRKDAALALVSSGKGKGYMDGIRAEIDHRLGQQQVQLNSALARSEKYTGRTYSALALLVLSAAILLAVGLVMMLRTLRLEAETVRLREVEQAERQTALVARELNHRVKNLFSIVLAIVQLASRGSASPKEAVERIRDRVHALARAHEVSLGADPMSGFDLETMLRTLLAPYAGNNAELELSGPPVQLPVIRVTPVGLIIHELATNAMKYGAWSDGGKVTVRWEIGDPPRRDSHALRMLRLHWDESRPGPLEAEGTPGFGSKLINAAVAQLDGSISRERADHGIRIVIDAPIIPEEARSEHVDES